MIRKFFKTLDYIHLTKLVIIYNLFITGFLIFTNDATAELGPFEITDPDSVITYVLFYIFTNSWIILYMLKDKILGAPRDFVKGKVKDKVEAHFENENTKLGKR